MDLFQSILANLKKKLDIETNKTEDIARITSVVLGMTITPSMISCRGKELSLKLPPTARMKLTLKREVLLLALQKESISITTIR